MANFNVVAKLTANVKDFQSGMKTAVSSVKDFERTTGSNFERVGKTISSVGSGLTNAITKPAIIAATAVGGLVATMGFKRLIGIDNAKAKLTGLGYDGQQVEGIMDEVAVAIKTGMTTMDEGVNIAAGAMAAGVAQGDELQRYIKLVGDAAVGANKPVNDMAQIFNRVQGSGKLMTQELNMIEDGMPGFSQAMAKHLGVGQEEFRKMVTDGKVSSDEFLDVMDEFAGGMAEAFAGTFSGMWGNIKAYIAIIGEALVGGLFEDIKGGMEKVIEVLSSDEAYAWAERTGQKIGEFAREVVEKVKDLIEWWNELSPAVKEVAVKFGLFLIALGPIMQILGPLITLIGIMAPIISSVAGFVGTLAFAFSAVAGGAATFGEAMLLIMGPVGWVIAGIVALIAVGVLLYKNWDKIKEYGAQLKDKFSADMLALKESVLQYFSELREQGRQTIENFKEQVIAPIIELKDRVVSYVTELKDRVISDFSQTKTDAVNYVNDLKTQAIASFDNLKTSITNAVETARTSVTDAFSRMKTWATDKANALKDGVVSAWETIKTKTATFFNDARESIISAFENIDLFAAGKAIIDGFVKGLRAKWDEGKEFITGIGGWIKDNKGPISYDRKLLVGAGEAIIGGLNKGLRDSFPDVKRTVSGMAGAIERSFTASPTMDISGSIARSNAQVRSAISHEISNKGTVQPAYINLSLGKRNYQLFVNDITNAQDGTEKLELSYR